MIALLILEAQSVAKTNLKTKRIENYGERQINRTITLISKSQR